MYVAVLFKLSINVCFPDDAFLRVCKSFPCPCLGCDHRPFSGLHGQQKWPHSLRQTYSLVRYRVRCKELAELSEMWYFVSDLKSIVFTITKHSVL